MTSAAKKKSKQLKRRCCARLSPDTTHSAAGLTCTCCSVPHWLTTCLDQVIRHQLRRLQMSWAESWPLDIARLDSFFCFNGIYGQRLPLASMPRRAAKILATKTMSAFTMCSVSCTAFTMATMEGTTLVGFSLSRFTAYSDFAVGIVLWFVLSFLSCRTSSVYSLHILVTTAGSSICRHSGKDRKTLEPTHVNGVKLQLSTRAGQGH